MATACASRIRSFRGDLLVLCWLAGLQLMLGATVAAQGVCDRTPQVRDKLMELAARSRCEDVTAGDLARVTKLDFSHSDVVWLHDGDFEGLSHLRTLNLSHNYLRTLPEEIFYGLNSLEELFIQQNKLSMLPVGVFNGLSSLRALWLQDNSKVGLLRMLPLGIFDDVLDTLEDLRVDPYLMSSIVFHSKGQSTVAGYTVRVRVRLTGILPVALRVPYSVEWTTTTDEDAGLPPLPHGELLYRPGLVPDDIVFTLSKDADSLSNMIEVRLGELSRIRLSRWDGTGPDAPHLNTESLLSRPEEGAIHTVTIVDAVPADVCDRTPQVRDELVEVIPEVSDCADITTAHLTGVGRLSFWGAGITTLRENDFSGLSSLEFLSLNSNSIRSLPEGIFSELDSLERLWLWDNPLEALPENIFQGLDSLQRLLLHDIQLHSLPEGIFRGLNNLDALWLQRNSLSSLPEGAFDGLDSLRSLLLSDNDFVVLPEGIFSGLGKLESLWLQGNALSSLPEGIFQGLSSLTSLILYRNSLTSLPEGVFRGLSNLGQLRLQRNSLNVLPEGIFRGLSDLEELVLTRNSLSALPERVFRGLSSLNDLALDGNSLGTLPEGAFRGLKALQRLDLSSNSLRSLPDGVFSGLSGLAHLLLNTNPLSELPQGILDDVLDTLGHEVLSDLRLFRGKLLVDSNLKAGISFSTASQRVAVGASVRIPVTLSRALPVAVRVPYTVGISGSTGGLTGLSPLRDRGLVFTAEETERGITFTLPKDSVVRGERTVLLALGDLEEIGLRRSDGAGPDAPYLETTSLLLGSDQGSIHTLTMYDFETDDQDPFCLSLWEGAPCSTVATLPHVLMGPLGDSVARTELVVTHRDPQATDCGVAVLFHQGIAQAPSVSFNGRFPDRNLLHATIPRAGAEILTLTAPDAQDATVGAISVFARSPCTAGSLHVQGRALLEKRVNGDVDELYSLGSQSSGDFLADGDCRRWTGQYGHGDDVVMAMVPGQPGQSAPPGTQLHFRAFDLKGNLVGALDSLEVSGRHQALSFGEFDQPTIIETCLDIPGASAFQLTVSVLGTRTTGTKVQFSTGSVPGDSESEDTGSGP
ncbi:MAG: leucine-rich repeat protein [Acidobacteria bacterium]|nr:leucine-rich repeat protein [Acidobacteriota bacterium]